MNKPIYTLDKLRFEIDNCLPQVSAVQNNKIEMHALTHGNYPGKALAAEQLAGISSMGFMHVVGEQDWGIEPHRNEGIEICFQENGTNTLTVDGKNYNTPAKTLTITRPWQLHQVGSPNIGPGRLHWIILDVGVRRPNQAWHWPEWCILTEDDKRELEQLLRGNEHPAWQANNEILNIFKRIQSYVTAEPIEPYISHLKIHLNHLLLALLELLRTQNIVSQEHLTTKARAVEVFLQELESNYRLAGYEWTLDDMARHCGMARSAFSNYCQQLTNTSPILFLAHCRLQHASRLLLNETYTSITDLAFELGFSNSQYFSRCFKEKYGLPPKQWLKQQRKIS
ncbi:AraC family transcriptional regulator [Saccharobesus litoralis]|uniref:AraC family transcriptional regulator n=1 Tax=Saccharobesus litoralis TaxID=2172099 RepID=A0A2S0VP55_9ALTE|nr:AraC family transcriptional regulator [Saccharobesus litoralis]AWB66001.1 AraC family transcriptional regulator [Saccharobesus litoralis]